MEGTLEAIKARTIEEGDCWVWQGAMSHEASPVMRLSGSRKIVYVRRFIALEILGIEAGKRKITTSCGNPACVNPEHVAAWTPGRIMKRAAQVTGYGNNPARNAKIAAGKRKHSPITPELVEEIRSSHESGRAIARRLGFCQATVQAIRAHETWKDYNSPFFQLAA